MEKISSKVVKFGLLLLVLTEKNLALGSHLPATEMAAMEEKDWMWAKNLSKELWSFQKQGYLCDMDIIGDCGATFKVHSCVMAATSSFCKAAVTDWWQTASTETADWRKTVETKIPQDLLHCVVRYLYTGQVKVQEQQRLDDLHAALAELGVKGICMAKDGVAAPTLPGNSDSDSDNQYLTDMDTEPEDAEPEVPLMDGTLVSGESTEMFMKQEGRKWAKPVEFDSGENIVELQETDRKDLSEKWPCGSCGKSFLTKWRLKKHMELHETGQQPFKCKTCGKCYSQHGSLWKHQQTHRAGRPFQCPWCSSAFKARHVLVGHVRSVHNTSIGQLQKLANDAGQQERVEAGEKNEASSSCASITELDPLVLGSTEPYELGQDLKEPEHMNAEDIIEEKEGSQDCQNTISEVSSPELGDHEDLNLTEYESLVHGCPKRGIQLCEGEPAAKKNLAVNAKEGETNELSASNKEKLSCSLCGKSFPSTWHLKKHTQVHEGKKPFKCQKCGKSYGSSGTLWTHQQSHRSDRCFRCPRCSSGFKARHLLMAHFRSVHNTYIRRLRETTGDAKVEELISADLLKCPRRAEDLQCPVCGKVFRNKYSVRTHMKVHSDIRPFVCHICGKTFKERPTLLDHVKHVHEGVRRSKKRYGNTEHYWCSFCFKGFKMKQHLLIHEMRHRGERPFQCRHCDHSFVTSTERKAHEGKHMDVLPYQCAVCGKGYASAGNLTWHMISHSDERPFPCAQCGKCFKTNAHRKRHETRHGNRMMAA